MGLLSFRCVCVYIYIYIWYIPIKPAEADKESVGWGVGCAVGYYCIVLCSGCMLVYWIACCVVNSWWALMVLNSQFTLAVVTSWWDMTRCRRYPYIPHDAVPAVPPYMPPVKIKENKRNSNKIKENYRKTKKLQET